MEKETSPTSWVPCGDASWRDTPLKQPVHGNVLWWADTPLQERFFFGLSCNATLDICCRSICIPCRNRKKLFSDHNWKQKIQIQVAAETRQNSNFLWKTFFHGQFSVSWRHFVFQLQLNTWMPPGNLAGVSHHTRDSSWWHIATRLPTSEGMSHWTCGFSQCWSVSPP